MQISYSDYAVLYGTNPAVESAFPRYSWDAERIVNDLTTGVDGVCKLKVAFPTDNYAVECVKRATAAVIDKMAQVDEMSRKLASGGVVKSRSAGNESISYEISGEISSAAASQAEQTRLYSTVIEHYLRGVSDANGVNLLFRGMYPYKV